MSEKQQKIDIINDIKIIISSTKYNFDEITKFRQILKVLTLNDTERSEYLFNIVFKNLSQESLNKITNINNELKSLAYLDCDPSTIFDSIIYTIMKTFKDKEKEFIRVIENKMKTISQDFNFQYL